MIPRYVLLLVSCWTVTCVLSSPGRPVYLGYQDSFGQYSFGYSAPGSARSEVRTLDGGTRGAYSYIDDAGVIHKTEYIADGVNGFRIVASNLPQPPLPVPETPEVAAARAAHLRAVEMASRLAQQASQKDSAPGNSINDEINAKTGQIAENQVSGESKQNAVQGKAGLGSPNASNLQENIRNSSSGSNSDGKIIDPQGIRENSTQLNEASLGKGAIQQTVENLNKISTAASRIGSSNLINSGQSVPVYEIVPGSLEIRVSGVQQASDSQGIPESIAPGRSPLGIDQAKDNGIENRENSDRVERPSNLRPGASISASPAAFVPVNVLPFTSTYSPFLRRPQFLPYVFYGVV